MSTGRARAALRRYALCFPGATEDFPWGETVCKVRGKVFVFFGHSGTGLGLSVKLPASSLLALTLPFASPTGHGLGKNGRVSAQFTSRDAVPLKLLEKWIDESYRAVAPKRLVAELEAGPGRRPRR
jgi:predicted DNA-binding protein (MmcQ/YjbR family)